MEGSPELAGKSLPAFFQWVTNRAVARSMTLVVAFAAAQAAGTASHSAGTRQSAGGNRILGVRLTLEPSGPAGPDVARVPGVTLILTPGRAPVLPPPAATIDTAAIPGTRLELLPPDDAAAVSGVVVTLSPDRQTVETVLRVDGGFSYRDRDFRLTSSSVATDVTFDFIPVSPLPFLDLESLPRASDLLPTARLSLAAPVLTWTAFLPESHLGDQSVILKPRVALSAAPVWLGLGAGLPGPDPFNASDPGAMLGLSPELGVQPCGDCRWELTAGAAWLRIPSLRVLGPAGTGLQPTARIQSRTSLDYSLRSIFGRIERSFLSQRLIVGAGAEVEDGRMRLETRSEADLGQVALRRREKLRFEASETRGFVELVLKLESRSEMRSRFSLGASGFAIDLRFGLPLLSRVRP